MFHKQPWALGQFVIHLLPPASKMFRMKVHLKSLQKQKVLKKRLSLRTAGRVASGISLKIGKAMVQMRVEDML